MRISCPHSGRRGLVRDLRGHPGGRSARAAFASLAVYCSKIQQQLLEFPSQDYMCYAPRLAPLSIEHSLNSTYMYTGWYIYSTAGTYTGTYYIVISVPVPVPCTTVLPVLQVSITPRPNFAVNWRTC